MYLPGTDTFINKFITMYKDKPTNDFKKSLVMCLLKSSVANMSVDADTVYFQLFFFYATLSTPSRKMVEFVS